MLPWQAEQQIFTPTRITVHTPSSLAPSLCTSLPFSSPVFSHLPSPLCSSSLLFPFILLSLLFPPPPSASLLSAPPHPSCLVSPKREVAASVRGSEKGSGHRLHRSSIQAFYSTVSPVESQRAAKRAKSLPVAFSHSRTGHRERRQKSRSGWLLCGPLQ